MTGQCLWFAISPTGSGFTNWLVFSKNGNDWWSQYATPHADFLALKAAAEQGRFWNANGFWRRAIGTAGSWVGAFSSSNPGNSIQCKGIGPCPYVPDDSFIF